MNDRYKKMVATRMARGGYKHTEETKAKCGLANKGKKLTAEHKERISKNNVRYWSGKKRPDMAGKNNWNYKKYGREHTRYKENKLSPLRKVIRNSEKYRQHKVEILKRDKYKCVICGKGSVYLELDHYPKGFSELLKENNITSIEEAILCEKLWELDNGRSLCQSCHETTANFPKQLIGKRNKFLYRASGQ